MSHLSQDGRAALGCMILICWLLALIPAGWLGSILYQIDCGFLPLVGLPLGVWWFTQYALRLAIAAVATSIQNRRGS